MKVLVTGGAGYIGSHMILALQEAGHQAVVVDDLSTGLASFVINAPLHVINLAEEARLDALFRIEKFDMVMHFAASIEVNESVRCPDKYYFNNFVNTMALLNVMRKHKVNNIIFSSTAAIFGDAASYPTKEEDVKAPINPYGASKLMCEQLLQDYDRAYGIKSICLRYFNAAGADPESRVGYRPYDASHLIPLVLQTALGKYPGVKVFGRDYPTRDGTCVRDYIHVMDLCRAHLLAMHYLANAQQSKQFNVGNSSGYSVQEVIEVARQVTGHAIPYHDAPRRAGDPAQLVADSALIRKTLGWQPQFPELATIVSHAYAWELRAAQQMAESQASEVKPCYHVG